jgi:hypothetical protein
VDLQTVMIPRVPGCPDCTNGFHDHHTERHAMTKITLETWNVTVDGRRVATVELPGSDADWSMITRYRDMLGGNAELSLAAYDNGTLLALRPMSGHAHGRFCTDVDDDDPYGRCLKPETGRFQPADRIPRMSNRAKAAALVEGGLADDMSDAFDQLEDMGELTDY